MYYLKVTCALLWFTSGIVISKRQETGYNRLLSVELPINATRAVKMVISNLGNDFFKMYCNIGVELQIAVVCTFDRVCETIIRHTRLFVTLLFVERIFLSGKLLGNLGLKSDLVTF